MKLTKVFKWIFVVQFCLVFLTINSTNVFAEDRWLELDEVIIDAFIDEAGDMHVVEYDTYTFHGTFNGIFVDLGLNKTDGIEQFSAYKIGENEKETKLNVEIEEYENKNRYKVYSVSENETKQFKFVYTYKNVIQVYQDTAELYFKFFDEMNTTRIESAVVNLTLPANVPIEVINVFAHGNQAGTYNIQYSGLINFEVSPVEAGQLFEVRVLFPPQYVPKSTRIDNVPKREQILLEEAQGKVRDEVEETDYDGNVRTWYDIIFGIPFVVIVIVANIRRIKYLSNKYINIYQSEWSGQYLRDLPSNLPPSLVQYLCEDNVTQRAITATLMDLVRKDVVILTKVAGQKASEDDYNFKLVNKSNVRLNKYEQMLIAWLFKNNGNKNILSLNKLKEQATSPDYAKINSVKWERWKKKVEDDIEKHHFYEMSNGGIGRAIFFNIVIQYSLFITLSILNFKPIGSFFMYLAPLCLFLAYSDKRKTVLGETEYAKWTAFKNYIRDYSQMSTREPLAVHLWEHYYVYAIVLGEAKKMDEISRVHLPVGSSENDRDAFSYLSYDLIENTLLRVITAAVPSSDSSDTSYDSGSFSSGGGDGGGGGGRGGF